MSQEHRLAVLAFQQAEIDRMRILEKNRAARARRSAPQPPKSKDGIVQLRCNRHGVIEDRISYSAIPLRLNGCTTDPKNPCVINIVGYDWERDIVE
jgi:hypothetical protein